MDEHSRVMEISGIWIRRIRFPLLAMTGASSLLPCIVCGGQDIYMCKCAQLEDVSSVINISKIPHSTTGPNAYSPLGIINSLVHVGLKRKKQQYTLCYILLSCKSLLILKFAQSTNQAGKKHELFKLIYLREKITLLQDFHLSANGKQPPPVSCKWQYRVIAQ